MHAYGILWQAEERNNARAVARLCRRQINLYRMFFADFSVNSQPILMKALFSSHAATTVKFS